MKKPLKQRAVRLTKKDQRRIHSAATHLKLALKEFRLLHPDKVEAVNHMLNKAEVRDLVSAYNTGNELEEIAKLSYVAYVAD